MASSTQERNKEVANNIHSKRITVGNLNIRYFAGGQGDPLIVIHGGGDGARSWRENAKELSRNYSVYIPDLPGFGHSQSANDKFHLPDFVTFIEDFADTLGLERFYLMGHSIGGGIALHYALKFPQKVKGLVLVSSWCLGKETALWVRLLSHPALCKSLGEAGIAILKGVKWLARLFYAPFKFANPLTRVKMDIGKTMTTLRGQTTVLLNQLSELTMPTLLVWGAGDRIVPAAHAYVAAELIPDCQLHIFEGCGHSVYKQRTEEFSQLLANFLD
ncbi:MAG: alpha/beta fold hydrolase [Chloroflexi bacterium]|nr:alpha/beta fold hydrolase [Chloroflexota bacterium]